MEQLQQTLNEAVKMRWKPRGCNTSIRHNGLMKFFWTSGWGDEGLSSIHDLFSKDSGLMEFMEWKGGLLNAYKDMSCLTAKEKINYFNTNATLPKMKFDRILKHYEKDIYNGKYEIVEVGKDIIYLTEKGDLFPKIVEKVSINDLLVPESGFLQAVEWNSTGMLLYESNGVDMQFHGGYIDWKYHAMKLSILSKEDKVKYLEDNVLI